MRDPFAKIADIAAAALAEPVTYRPQGGGAPFNTRGVVVVGNGLTPSAGSMVHAETAARYTVVISRGDWPDGAPPPRFGDTLSVALFGTMAVKQVTDGPHEWTIRCNINTRGGR